MVSKFHFHMNSSNYNNAFVIWFNVSYRCPQKMKLGDNTPE